MDFVCPKCKGILTQISEKVKKCPLGHSFDRAKEGYYNFLLSTGGGVHGDNADMVRARREFLSYGYYEPLAVRLSELVLRYTERGGSVIDAGLGEGYYTDRVEKDLTLRDNESCVFGFDISKDAVKRAQKRNSGIKCAVASSYDMPFPIGCADTVMNVFSPLATDEVKRVLKSGGHFIIVYPGKRHLFGLKSKIYDTPYLNVQNDKEIPDFELVYSDELSYTVKIEGTDRIRSLFMMTPYAYRTGKEGRERVLALEEIETEIEFNIDVYKKI